MELSKRLQAVADLLDSHPCIADIGCDHGFVSIYLIRSHKAKRCIAMDVNQGPLERAAAHIKQEGLSTYIETRLSDGAKALNSPVLQEGGVKAEAQAALIAGMGGRLTIRILQDSLEKFQAMEEVILQPQSEIWKVREFIEDQGWRILKEDIILEEGKFYPMMKVLVKGAKGIAPHKKEADGDLFYHYGEYLLKTKNKVLFNFLKNEKRLYETILQNLQENETPKTKVRIEEIKEMLNRIEKGLEWFADEM